MHRRLEHLHREIRHHPRLPVSYVACQFAGRCSGVRPRRCWARWAIVEKAGRRIVCLPSLDEVDEAICKTLVVGDGGDSEN